MDPSTLTVHGLNLSSVLQQLYGDIDGYKLSGAGRERAGISGEDYTYGEVTPDVVEQVLRVTGAKPGDVFYDLGSGTGKAVIFASMMLDLKKAVGIELLEELHAAARIALQRYRETIEPSLPQNKTAQQIELLLADMRTVDVSDGDILFSHCTCFTPEMMALLAAKAATLKPGARVVTVSRELPSDVCALLGSDTCRMAWGNATLYWYERR